MSFDWQTERNQDSEQSERWLPEPRLRPRRRRLWILLPLALVVAAIVVAGRQVNERVVDVTYATKEDVLSSHALARRAAAQKDEELWVSLLSGHSGEWLEAQKERLLHGLLFEDSLRPFGFRPLARPAADPEVTLNPELSEAVVQEVQPFAVDAGEGLTSTIHLIQTFVYRRGEQRWLLSPPDDDFWGARQTLDGALLTLIAPERDQELAVRLGRDIDAKLDETCRELVACPQSFRVRLRLEKDPATVNEAAEVGRLLGAEQTLTLPAPTLLGVPVDDGGYDALYRVYARHVVAAAIGSITGAEKSTLARARREGVIRVGFANEAPYAFAGPGGVLTGQAIAVAGAIFHELGIPEMEGVLTPFSSLFPGLQAGRFDAITAGMYILPERCRHVLFADPDYKIGEALIVQEGNPHNLHSYEDIANNPGVTVGIGGPRSVEYRYLLAAGVRASRIVFSSPYDSSAIAGLLQAGTIDAWAGPRPSQVTLLQSIGDPGLELADPFEQPTIDGESVITYGGAAFRYEDLELRQAFNEELQALKDSGKLLDLIGQFDGFDEAALPGDVYAEDICPDAYSDIP